MAQLDSELIKLKREIRDLKQTQNNYDKEKLRITQEIQSLKIEYSDRLKKIEAEYKDKPDKQVSDSKSYEPGNLVKKYKFNELLKSFLSVEEEHREIGLHMKAALIINKETIKKELKNKCIYEKNKKQYYGLNSFKFSTEDSLTDEVTQDGGGTCDSNEEEVPPIKYDDEYIKINGKPLGTIINQFLLIQLKQK